MTDYIAENGRRIYIIRQLPINNSVQFLGVSAQAWERGLPFHCNLQAPDEATGWGRGHTYNQKWVGRMFDADSITNISWGDSVDPLSGFLPRSPVKPHTA